MRAWPARRGPGPQGPPMKAWPSGAISSRAGRAATPSRPGLSGDEVELVPLDIGEGDPVRPARFDLIELLRTEAQQAFGLGLEGVAEDVEVDPVLDDFRLGHLVEDDPRAAGRPVGEQGRMLRSRVLCDLQAEDVSPEPGQG